MSSDRSDVSNRDIDGTYGYAKRILTIGTRYFDRLFTGLLLVFFGVLIVLTPQYDPGTRLFPLVIGVPSLLLVGILLLALVSSRVSAVLSRFTAADMFGFEEQFSDETGDRSAEDTLLARRKRLLSISLWMFFLFALVLLVGFLPATVVFLLGFYLLYTDCGWKRSTIYTIIFTLMIVAIFGVIMDMRFYSGVLGIDIPI